MSIAPYRSILALPGVLRLLGFAVLARVPHAASSVVITLYVVLGLGRGYGAAGLVAAVSTIGTAIGSPWRGRAVDRVGLRRALIPSVLVEGGVWTSIPFLGYRELLLAAFVGGLLSVPIFTVVRQSLAILVPAGQQRAAYALDSIGTELTFMVGPAVGVVLATQWSTTGTVIAMGGSVVLVGLGLIAFNPPTRSEPDESVVAAGTAEAERELHRERQQADREPQGGAGGTRALLFNPQMLAVLAATAGSLAVLAGTDVSIVAHVRADGQVALSWVVFLAWSLSSMLGGIVFGLTRRAVPVNLILLGLGLLTIPIGASRGTWWLALAIVPAGFLCAPAISATATTISRLVPEQRRGEAMGWYGSAMTLGMALGTPAAGIAIDHLGPWAGFALLGTLGVSVALTGLLLIDWLTDRPGSDGQPDEPGAPSGVSPTRRLTVPMSNRTGMTAPGSGPFHP
jgi:MFS family permease